MAKRELAGGVAIVTGASSGIGWQTAVRLAGAGMKLCVTARREEALAQLAQRIQRDGGECLAVPGDVSVEHDVARVVSECVARYGRLDLLVNNAGIQAYAPFEQYEWSEIERIFEVTCFGQMRFARAALPHFHRQKAGHIVCVESMLSVGAAPLLSAYSAAKHALLGWSESLRLELRGSGIDVSAILAPSVATPMFDHARSKLGLAPRPIPPTYDPDVVARAVVRCARAPQPKVIPVFLQGSLILWMQRRLPFVGDWILGKYGARLQMREQPVDPRGGNLFQPVPEGVGPYGSVPPTPRWRRYGAALALGLLAGGAVGGTAYGAVRLRGWTKGLLNSRTARGCS